jgi:hypothetical protein
MSKREDNIKMHLIEIGWAGVDLIPVAQDRRQWGSSGHGNEPFGFIKGGEFHDYFSDY